METAKKEAEGQRLMEQYEKKRNAKRVYVDHKETAEIKERYLSTEQYYMIAQLYVFLEENPNLSNEEVAELIKSKWKFRFLAKLIKYVPNALDELRFHGPQFIALRYAEHEFGRQKKDVPLP